MTNRQKTYIVFHTDEMSSTANSDIKHYNLLKTWTLKKDSDFEMIYGHEKRAARRDAGLEDALQKQIESGLQNAKHLLLVIERTHRTTRQPNQRDWVSQEISYAADECNLPIIAAYTHYEYVLAPNFLSNLWPKALASRIESGSIRVMHIPFKKTPIKTAINQFYPANPPSGPLAHYSERTYKKWGLIK